jgi:DNA-binding IscR family transcriptional regulator
MDYTAHDASDEINDLDKSLATFSLHTSVQRHDGVNACSLHQAWDGIERTIENHVDMKSLSDVFLIVS